MCTRATIAVEDPETREIKSIYLHFDGEGAAAKLKKHYKDIAKANRLIELGNLSSLGKEIGKVRYCDPKQADQTVAYGRDLGEQNTEAITYHTWQDFIASDRQKYTYIYKEGQWCLVYGGTQKTILPG